MSRQRNIVLIVALTMIGLVGAQTRPYVSDVWVSDQGDGTYRNPILYSDYSDPDVCRVGEDYYMTASSFASMPGLPILHSKDLVNWSLIGHALPRMFPAEIYDKPQHAKSVWAPSIRFHKGLFYIYWGDPDLGLCMVQTEHPAGPWSEPVVVKEGKGLIDCCPLWDEDGQAYLVHAWAASRAQINSILTVHKMNAAGTAVIDAGRHVFDGHEKHPTMEGAKFYRHNGYYYIFAPAGGVPKGWQVVLRSRDIYGPYEDRTVLAQGSTEINGPHQGAWVGTPSGQSWFIHFQEKEPYGRIVHLQPMQWHDDWPVMGVDTDGDGCGEPVLSYAKPDVGRTWPVVTPVDTDEFDSGQLGLQWQWNANPDIRWSIMLRDKDYLRLFAMDTADDPQSLWNVPNLLLQKFPAPNFVATTKVALQSRDQGVYTGLTVFGRNYDVLTLSPSQGRYRLAHAHCRNADRGGREQLREETLVSGNVIYLRVTVKGPDAQCQFSYSLDDQDYQGFGPGFQAREGAWIGAKVGIFCLRSSGTRGSGYADFDWFRMTAN